MALHRRSAGVGLARRRGRTVHDAPGNATYQSILGALLVEMWHSQLGIAPVSGNVDTWTGQVGGRVLQAPSAGTRPTYVPDGAFASGKNMVVSDAAASRCVVNAALTALAANGTRPYVIAAARFVTYPAGTAWAMRPLDTGGGAEGTSLLCLSGTTLAALGGVVTRAFSDATQAHTFESGFTAAGANLIGVDASYTTAGSGVSVSGNTTRLGIGGAPAGTNCASVAHALYLFCSAQPSVAQIAAVTALAKAEFGY